MFPFVGMNHISEFVKSVVSYFYPLNSVSSGTRVGVCKYSSTAAVQFHLNTFTTRNELICAIDSMSRSQGTTYTGTAMNLVRTGMLIPSRFVLLVFCLSLKNRGARGNEFPKVVVLITGLSYWLCLVVLMSKMEHR